MRHSGLGLGATLALGIAAESPGSLSAPGTGLSASITRRHLQVALGLLWLLDGVLQAQPFMFTRGFATQVIAAAGQGQPGFVAVPIDWVANVVAAHPVAWNVPFAAIQLLLGLGLLVPRTARLTLAASIAWALECGTSAKASQGGLSSRSRRSSGAVVDAVAYHGGPVTSASARPSPPDRTPRP